MRPAPARAMPAPSGAPNASGAAPCRWQGCVDVDAPWSVVLEALLEFEALPARCGSVRRVLRIAEDRVLWDVDVWGRHFVWEAAITVTETSRDGARLRWVSRHGTPIRGETRIEELGRERSRLRVEMALRPRGLVEHLGVRLGVPRRRLARDLERFRAAAEREHRSRARSLGLRAQVPTRQQIHRIARRA